MSRNTNKRKRSNPITTVLFLLITAAAIISCNPGADYSDDVVELSFDSYQSEEAVLTMIDKAEESIYIALYGFDNDSIAESMIRAKKRGVTIEMVTEYDSEHYSSYQRVIKEGIPVKLANCGNSADYVYDALMHNKYFIIDGKYIITGSTNLTSGMFIHFNNLIVLKSASLAAEFKKDFDVMNAGYFGSYKTAGYTAVHGGNWDETSHTIGDFEVQVFFTPYHTSFSPAVTTVYPTNYATTAYTFYNHDDGYTESTSYSDARNVIIKLLQNAQSSVRFLVFSFTDRVIIDELMNAKDRGVDVKIWMDHLSAEQSDFIKGSYLAMAAKLGDENAKKCWRPNDGLLHHKVLIVDNTIVIGSLNFSKSGAMRNDENFLVIRNADPIVKAFNEEMHRIDGESLPISTTLSK
ncbi:MAG: phosphatidylserine/phosphatidylglycerophosphate/cardiolipin synthase family protein [bacterium]|nr:phosphatidylserine/phosphatidylglycerophosphate/cardiolipin synthase family protein [bacterium]